MIIKCLLMGILCAAIGIGVACLVCNIFWDIYKKKIANAFSVLCFNILFCAIPIVFLMFSYTTFYRAYELENSCKQVNYGRQGN